MRDTIPQETFSIAACPTLLSILRSRNTRRLSSRILAARMKACGETVILSLSLCLSFFWLCMLIDILATAIKSARLPNAGACWPFLLAWLWYWPFCGSCFCAALLACLCTCRCVYSWFFTFPPHLCLWSSFAFLSTALSLCRRLRSCCMVLLATRQDARR